MAIDPNNITPAQLAVLSKKCTEANGTVDGGLCRWSDINYCGLIPFAEGRCAPMDAAAEAAARKRMAVARLSRWAEAAPLYAGAGGLAGTAVSAVGGWDMKKGAGIGAVFGLIAARSSGGGIEGLGPIMLGLASLPVIGVALAVRRTKRK